jgi:hypothetical protein
MPLSAGKWRLGWRVRITNQGFSYQDMPLNSYPWGYDSAGELEVERRGCGPTNASQWLLHYK